MRWLLIATRKQCLPWTVVFEMAAKPSSSAAASDFDIEMLQVGSSRPGGRYRKQTMLMVVRATLSRSGSETINLSR